MIITRLEELDKSKVKVYIDEEYAFLLYQKDIKLFQLEEGGDISAEIFHKIHTDTVLRRAKQKALAILKFMDRTEYELRRKLFEADYTEEIISQTIDYVYEYGYLNDERFAASFVRLKKNNKSKKVLRLELSQKGIKNEIIDKIFTSEYIEEEDTQDPECVAIQKAIAKKTKAPECLSSEEKQKLMASLYRKGFDIDKIKQFL
jgi:regulatory protein